MTIGRNTFIYPGLTLYIMYPSCWPFKIIRDTVFKHCWSHSANMVSHVSFDRRMPKNTVGSPWPSPNGPGHKPKDVAHDQQNWAGSVVDLETEKKDYGWLANPMSQTSMFGGLPMLFFGLSMAFHGFPWLSMAFHGFPLLSMAFRHCGGSLTNRFTSEKRTVCLTPSNLRVGFVQGGIHRYPAVDKRWDTPCIRLFMSSIPLWSLCFIIYIPTIFH